MSLVKGWGWSGLEGRRAFAAALVGVTGAVGAVLAGLRADPLAGAAIGAVGLAAALTVLYLTWRKYQGDAPWSVEPMRVRDLKREGRFYDIGVDTEAPQALALLDRSPGEHPGYLPRKVDARLRERLRSAGGSPGVHLVIVSGRSKSGKSRTALEAVAATLGESWLVAPRDAAALEGLARQRPSRRARGHPCVVWIDDIEPMVGATGLNAATLTAFRRWPTPVLILATQGGKGLGLGTAALGRSDERVADLLTRHPPIELDHRLCAKEMELVTNAVPSAAADQIESDGLGEFMIAAPRLLDRLGHGDSAEGRAVAHAAIDCQRAGLLNGVTQTDLADLYERYLPGPATSERLVAGLTWATQPLYSRVALLMDDTSDGPVRYRPHDYLVDFAAHGDKPIDPHVLERVAGRLAQTEEELLRVAAASRRARRFDLAETAYRRADENGSAAGAVGLGEMLHRRGENEGAEAAFGRGDERGNARGACLHGWKLYGRGEMDLAEAAYGRAERRGHPHAAVRLGDMLWHGRDDPLGAMVAFARAEEAGEVEGAFERGQVMQALGNPEGAEAAYARAEPLAHAADERGWYEGSYFLGWLLDRRGETELAFAAYRRAEERGSTRAPWRLGQILERRGDFVEAEAAYLRALEAQVSSAAIRIGWLRERRGALEGALAVYTRAEKLGAATAAVDVARVLEATGDATGAEAAYRRAERNGIGRGLYHLALLLERRGRTDEAEEMFVRAEEAYRREESHGDVRSTADLGAALHRRGEHQEAFRAFERADAGRDVYGSEWLGWMLEDRGDLGAAEAAYSRGDVGGSGYCAYCLGRLLAWRGRKGEAFAAYTRGDKRGHAKAALELGRMLIQDERVTSARAAFERALDRADLSGDSEIAVAAREEIARLSANLDPA